MTISALPSKSKRRLAIQPILAGNHVGERPTEVSDKGRRTSGNGVVGTVEIIVFPLKKGWQCCFFYPLTWRRVGAEEGPCEAKSRLTVKKIYKCLKRQKNRPSLKI